MCGRVWSQEHPCVCPRQERRRSPARPEHPVHFAQWSAQQLSVVAFRRKRNGCGSPEVSAHNSFNFVGSMISANFVADLGCTCACVFAAMPCGHSRTSPSRSSRAIRALGVCCRTLSTAGCFLTSTSGARAPVSPGLLAESAHSPFPPTHGSLALPSPCRWGRLGHWVVLLGSFTGLLPARGPSPECPPTPRCAALLPRGAKR